MGLVQVLLANPHPLIRNSLRLLLERERDFRIVGEAANGREAVVLAEYRHPDVVLLDIQLPHLDGLSAAREISGKNRKQGIVFVTANADQEYVSEAFKAGARGYVLADSAQTELVRAVRVVALGGTFLSPIITSQILEEYARTHWPEEERISEHDRQLFCLLAEGYDDHEIARCLNSSPDTITSDCQNMKKVLLDAGMPELIKHSIGR
jgi:DNA-binding NarL/FixJ family response regulator